MKNESARVDARLLVDYQTILEGHCKYVPHLLGGATDWSRIQALARDLDNAASADSGGMVRVGVATPIARLHLALALGRGNAQI